ncbi:MAG TPA: dihydroxy-acid dehydratase, partial [Acidobacteriaceae bacterium]
MTNNGSNGKTAPGKLYSIALTEGPNRAPARAMLRAVGFTPEDLRKPIIGIANTWTEIGPCNFHLRALADAVKQGIREAGGTPMEFNTVTISDGITMGTEGMKASLISREVIADSVELVTRGNQFDGLVAIAGCDKNMPGTVMALARLDIPGLMLYGGSIAPGHLNGKDLTVQDVFEAVGAHAAGKLDDAGLEAVEANACPGVGACGGQFTANTMAMACEFLGISPIGLSGVPGFLAEKLDASREAGRMVMELVRRGVKPSQIITPKAIENAIASVAASGGSTNAVLHFLAIANEAGIPLTVDDFDRISNHTPLLCDLKPGGKYVAVDYQAAGGSRLLAKRLIDAGLIDGSCLNASGKTLAEEAALAKETPGQDVIHTVDKALKSTGGLVILKGNLAPEGCVIKVAGHKRLEHRGPARVFDTEDAAFHAVESGQIKPGDVMVIRYEGPVGGPGMREML